MQKKQGQDFSFPPLLLQNILNRNDKSEHITNLDNVVRIIIVWSECNYRISENADISMVAGSRQEVFILKIQNDKNNAAYVDNRRRFS